MPIFIPAVFNYRDNEYKLGAETITLDDATPAADASPDDSIKHTLFEAMLKYIIAPVSDRGYSSYEDNLRYYLDSDLLSNAAKENPEMEFDKTLYDTHINWAWERIKSLTTKDFLDLAWDKVGTRNSGPAKTITKIRNGMEQEGLDEPIINILDREGGIGSSGQDKIMSYQTKGETASRLWRAANEQQGRKKYLAVLDEIENSPEDYIEIDEWIKGGIKTLVIKIDFAKAFDNIIQEQGLQPIKERISGAFGKSVKGMDGGTTPKELHLYNPPEKVNEAQQIILDTIQDIQTYNHLIKTIDWSRFDASSYEEFPKELQEVIIRLSKNDEIKQQPFSTETGEEFDTDDMFDDDLKPLNYSQKQIKLTSDLLKIRAKGSSREEVALPLEIELGLIRQRKGKGKAIRAVGKKTKQARKIVHAHEHSPYHDRKLFGDFNPIEPINSQTPIDLRNAKSFHGSLKDTIEEALSPIEVGQLMIRVSGQVSIGEKSITEQDLLNEKRISEDTNIPENLRRKHQKVLEEEYGIFYLEHAGYLAKWKYNYRPYTQVKHPTFKDTIDYDLARGGRKDWREGLKYRLSGYKKPKSWGSRTDEGGHAPGIRTKQIHTLQYFKKQLMKLKGMITDA